MAGAVILAAGAGTRYSGGDGKALAQWGGMSFLERVYGACRDAGCAPIVVVLRADDAAVEALARKLGAELAVNRAPERGMFSSVRIGLATALTCEPPAAGFVVFAVDHPLVRAETVRQLTAALPAGENAVWTWPRYDGRPGHPIAVTAYGAVRLLDAEPELQLRDALAACGLIGIAVDVDDDGVLRNINRPADLPAELPAAEV